MGTEVPGVSGYTTRLSRAKVKSKSESLLLWLFLFGATLHKAQLLPNSSLRGVAVADALLGLVVVIIAARVMLRAGGPRLDGGNILLGLLVVWAGIGGLVTQIVNPAFDPVEFGKSFLKLSYYAAAVQILIPYMREVGSDRTRSVVQSVLLFNAVIGLYVFVVQKTAVPWPVDFLWYGLPEDAYKTSFYRIGHFVVLRGHFSEPAAFASWQALGLAYLYSTDSASRSHRRGTLVRGIVILSMILTMSLTSVAFLALLVMLFLMRPGNRTALRTTGAVAACAALGIMIFVTVGLTHSNAVAGLATPFWTAFGERLMALARLEDNSSAARLIGSWHAAGIGLVQSPLVGIGLGQYDIYLRYYQSPLPFRQELISSGGGWNSLAYVAGSLGLIGLMVFLLYVMRLLALNWRLGVVFFAYLFAGGSWLEVPFWVYYALFASAARRKGDADENRKTAEI